MLLIIGIASVLVAAAGFVGHLVFLMRSFGVGDQVSPQEKAAFLSWNIQAAMISNVAWLVGMVGAVVGPLTYWLATGAGDPWEK